MESLYESLGFKQPEFVENPCGIRIYLGTKDKEDWCVEIPKELVQIKCPRQKPIGYLYDRRRRGLEDSGAIYKFEQRKIKRINQNE